jgi:hypothetical protein
MEVTDMPFRKSRTLKIAVVAVGLGSILGVAGISAASDDSSGPPQAKTLAGGDLTARRDEVFNQLAGLSGKQGFAVGVDPTKNEIHAFVFGSAASTDGVSLAELGSDVTLDRVDGTAAPANDAFSGTVLGRDATANPAGHCTAGFAVRIDLGTPRPSGFLTAGHCLDQTVPENQQTFFAGSATNNIPLRGFQSSMGGADGEDWAIVVNDPPSDNTLPQINTSTGFKVVKGISAPAVGDPICKQGRTTGTTCGTVTVVDTRISYAASTDDRGNPRPAYQIDHAFVTNNCVEGGDSGGPVYNNSGSADVRALGIVSGAVTSTVRGSGPPLCLEKLGGRNISFMIPFSALPVTTNPFDHFTLEVG